MNQLIQKILFEDILQKARQLIVEQNGQQDKEYWVLFLPSENWTIHDFEQLAELTTLENSFLRRLEGHKINNFIQERNRQKIAEFLDAPNWETYELDLIHRASEEISKQGFQLLQKRIGDLEQEVGKIREKLG